MTDIRTLILTYARALWRRRWYGAAVAWLVCLAGWAFVTHLPDMYEAKARIYVDTESMLRPLLRGIAVDTNLLSQVDIMQRTLLSRPNLQKVSHMADLALSARTPADAEEVVNQLRQRIVLTAEGRNLFGLAYTGPSRETASKVVQSLLTVFVESNLGNSRKDMVSARTFIDDQLRDYAQQLDQAEKRIADFKAANLGFLPGDSNYSTKLDVARSELTKTQAELDENRQRRDALVQQETSIPKYIDSFVTGPGDFSAGPPLAGPGETGPSSDPNQRVAEIEQKLRVLRENDTDQHPDVVRMLRLLDQAKEEARQARQKAAKATSNMPVVDPRARKNTAPNPVYEQLELQRVGLDTSIASLESRRAREQAEVEKWQKLATSVPEVGAELAKLTRDYDVIKRAYDELLNRRESAKIGSDMETQTQSIQFRIVDPPEAPAAPVAPNRALLISVVLVGGIASGFAFAFLLGQMDDSLLSVRQLRDLLAVPILGTISLASKAGGGRWLSAKSIAFSVLCLGLVAVYAGMMVIGTVVRLHA